jgi:hypothetical protein
MTKLNAIALIASHAAPLRFATGQKVKARAARMGRPGISQM